MKKHQIRIVGGAYRRTLISVPDGVHLRPTPDRVRETVFNWLFHFWQDTFASRQVLDLFAGSGALGFEAASRGVRRVDMVECNKAALAGLHATQARIRAPAVHIHACDAIVFLKGLQQPGYDLMLLDPPFEGDWLERLQALASRAMNPGGLIYIESGSALDNLPVSWPLLRQARAGRVHYGLARFDAMQKNMNNGGLEIPRNINQQTESA